MTGRTTATDLPRRTLGRTGLSVSGLGLGGAGIGGGYGEVSDRDAVETVHYALEHGINYIDTSPLYGESERRLGLALKGGLRQRVVLSTKTGTHPQRRGDYSWDATMWSVENIRASTLPLPGDIWEELQSLKLTQGPQ